MTLCGLCSRSVSLGGCAVNKNGKCGQKYCIVFIAYVNNYGYIHLIQLMCLNLSLCPEASIAELIQFSSIKMQFLCFTITAHLLSPSSHSLCCLLSFVSFLCILLSHTFLLSLSSQAAIFVLSLSSFYQSPPLSCHPSDFSSCRMEPDISLGFLASLSCGVFPLNG